MKKYNQKELEVEIKIDGIPLQGTSTIFVKDGVVDYSLAEEHFYEIIRKWEADWIKEAQDEEKEFIVDNLTPEQEEILKNKHAEHYTGTDDDMPDEYENWLLDLSLDELKELLPKEIEELDTEDLYGYDQISQDDSHGYTK